jgi:hypothetical protein
MSSPKDYDTENKQGKFKKKFLSFFFFILIIVLFCTGLYFYFINRGANNQSGDFQVNFRVEGPSEVQAASSNSFSLIVENHEKNDLENLEIKIESPSNFTVDGAEPLYAQKIEKGYIWFLKNLPSNASKKINFQGRYLGPSTSSGFNPSNDENLFLKGTLSFNLVGFNPLFEKRASLTSIIKPAVSWEVSYPSIANSGSNQEVSFSLQNLLNDRLEGLRIVMPDNLIFAPDDALTKINISIDTTATQNVWEIQNLDAQSILSKKFKVIVSVPPGQADFVFHLEKKEGDDYFGLSSATKTVQIEKPDLALATKVDGEAKDNFLADWGEEIPVRLTYSNNSDQVLSFFRLDLFIDGTDIGEYEPTVSNWPYDKSFDNGGRSEKIVWSKIADGNQLAIAPNASGEREFKIVIKNWPEISTDKVQKGEIKLRVQASYAPVNDRTEQTRVILAEKNLDIKIKTNFQVSAETHYYTDDVQPIPIGEGPLPFRANATTSLWLFIRIKNTSNPLQSVKVRTTLSQKLAWSGTVDASLGAMFYNAETRELTWEIDKLDPYQGGIYSFLEAKTKISFNPSSGDIGQIIPFTSKISYEAQDIFTQENISGETTQLDSRLSDSILNWHGEVQYSTVRYE